MMEPWTRQGVSRVEGRYWHQNLAVTIVDDTTGARSSLRLVFANEGDRPITVTDVAPFIGIVHGFRGMTSVNAPHAWPHTVIVDNDPLPLVLQPGKSRSYSISMLYDLEGSRANADARATPDNRLVVEYFLRIETLLFHGVLSLSSFRYATRHIATGQAEIAPGAAAARSSA
jgi:hypothetical protein